MTVRRAVLLVHPSGQREGYLMPEGTSEAAATRWGKANHDWPLSVFVVPLVVLERLGDSR
jgi:hypothetical protein